MNFRFKNVGISVLSLAVWIASSSVARDLDLSESVKGPPGVELNEVFFENATIYLSPSKKIENAKLHIQNGRILNVGTSLEVSESAKRIDLAGKVIYPAFIDAWSHLGLKEVDGSYNPWRSDPQYETTKKGAWAWNEAVRPETHVLDLIEGDRSGPKNLRKIGFGSIHLVPNDGIFRGHSSLMSLEDGESHEKILSGNLGQALSFERGSSKQSYPTSLMGSIALIRQTLIDAKWYQEIQSAWINRSDIEKPRTNLSLLALGDSMESSRKFFFEVGSLENLFRAQRIANEMGVEFTYLASGSEYQRTVELKEVLGDRIIILPLDFPKAPGIRSVSHTRKISLRELKHWNLAPSNPALLSKAGIRFAFTTEGLSQDEFWKSVHDAIARGLTPQEALAALTLRPAKLLGVSDVLGTIAPGKLANFIVSSGSLFTSKNSKVLETWISGKRYSHYPDEHRKLEGDYLFLFSENRSRIKIQSDGEKLTAKAQVGERSEWKKVDFKVKGSDFTFDIKRDGKTWTFLGKKVEIFGGQDLFS